MLCWLYDIMKWKVKYTMHYSLYSWDKYEHNNLYKLKRELLYFVVYNKLHVVQFCQLTSNAEGDHYLYLVTIWKEN